MDWTHIALMLAVAALLVRIMVLERKVAAMKRENIQERERSEFYIESKKLAEYWVRKKGEGKEAVSYFERAGIKKIAIYGITQAGLTLYSELKGTDVTVVCGIDRRINWVVNGLHIMRLDTIKYDGILRDVEAIVVTPIYDFAEIYEMLNQKLDGKIPVLGFDEILCEL